jgi:hypothetical protein
VSPILLLQCCWAFSLTHVIEMSVVRDNKGCLVLCPEPPPFI